MQSHDIIDKLAIVQERISSNLPTRLRPFIREASIQDKRALLVLGPRGVGKTTLLLSQAQKKKLLYVSVDSPNVANYTLTELGELAFGAGYLGIIFDEVHFASEWSLHAKSLYDSYPKKQIWLSDSSSLVLRSGLADLSRRFPKLSVPFLSFREYLSLSRGIELDPFDPFSSKKHEFLPALEYPELLADFKDYKQQGFRPIFLEGDYREKILNIIEKSIYSDIPFFVPQIQDNHLRLMTSVLDYLAVSNIPSINIDSLTNRWGIGKDKIYQLLSVAHEIELISIVRYKKDRKAVSKGAKTLLADPSMYAALGGQLGNVREAFVAAMFRQMKKNLYACRNEQEGDFETEELTIEVGGREKRIKKADFVVRDDLDFPSEKVVPMWAVGMMY